MEQGRAPGSCLCKKRSAGLTISSLAQYDITSLKTGYPEPASERHFVSSQDVRESPLLENGDVKSRKVAASASALMVRRINRWGSGRSLPPGLKHKLEAQASAFPQSIRACGDKIPTS